MNGLIDIQNIALVFLFLLAVLALARYISKKVTPSNPTREKRKMYASGEDIRPEKLNIPYQGFFSVIIKVFRLERAREWHSGDLSRYLTWIFTGMVVMILIFMLAWQI